MFVLGGAVPLIVVVVIIACLPYSPRYLLTRPNSAHRLRAILIRIDPLLSATIAIGPEDPNGKERAVSIVFELQGDPTVGAVVG